MQEGVVGLLRALERYDPERGAPFWMYHVVGAPGDAAGISELSGPVVLSDRALASWLGSRAPNAGSGRPVGEIPRPPSCGPSSACPRRRSSLLRTERAARG